MRNKFLFFYILFCFMTSGCRKSISDTDGSLRVSGNGGIYGGLQPKETFHLLVPQFECNGQSSFFATISYEKSVGAILEKYDCSNENILIAESEIELVASPGEQEKPYLIYNGEAYKVFSSQGPVNPDTFAPQIDCHSEEDAQGFTYRATLQTNYFNETRVRLVKMKSVNGGPVTPGGNVTAETDFVDGSLVSNATSRNFDGGAVRMELPPITGLNSVDGTLVIVESSVSQRVQLTCRDFM